METKILVGIYVFFSLLVIISLLLLPCECNQPNPDLEQENFKKCVCSNGGYTKRDCQDTEVVEKEYESGQLTEFTDLPKRGWNKTSPGDINWPVSVGCSWPDVENSGGWAKWDFTDFGS